MPIGAQLPPSEAGGCEDCLKVGSIWAHLRLWPRLALKADSANDETRLHWMALVVATLTIGAGVLGAHGCLP
jgi:hypothetical protein